MAASALGSSLVRLSFGASFFAEDPELRTSWVIILSSLVCLTGRATAFGAEFEPRFNPHSTPGDANASGAAFQFVTDAPSRAPSSQLRADVRPDENELDTSGEDRGYDASLVRTGETAFGDYCTQCHDAQRALQKVKSLAGWRATVRRMADKDGADIPSDVHEAIATYLAAQSGPPEDADAGLGSAADAAPAVSVTGTIAPWWRGGGSSDLQNPGFFGDVWVGAAWQGSGPVSGRATACISCHNEGALLNRMELVEAVVRFDLSKWWRSRCGTEPALEAAVEAGRVVVPFGAFSQQVNPSVYRTVTKPLIYNMGQQVRRFDLGDPVLPMPYADEGAVAELSAPLFEGTTATFDAYLVNGLRGAGFGVDFFGSREYVDNNRSPALGGRLAIGSKHLRLGTSVTGGRFNVDEGTGTLREGMDYLIYGADAVFRWQDILRLQFEYAQRDADRLGNIPAPTMFREHISGCYAEAEMLVSRCWQLSLLARYDAQSRCSPLPPPGSSLTTGDFSTERFTYGLNWTLPGGSLLMVNHEHWFLPGNFSDIDVLGVRWAAAF